MSHTRPKPPTFYEAASVFDAAIVLDTLWTQAIRSRRWWSAWFATCCSRVSTCHKSR